MRIAGHSTTPPPSFTFLAALALVCVAIMSPLFIVMALWHWPESRDLLFYAIALKVFSAQLWAGDPYPRWLTDTNAGYGSPVFLFYGPLSFYLGSLFQWAAGIDPYGFFRVLGAMTLTFFLAGVTCLRWLRLLMPDENAEKGALLYVVLLYLFLFVSAVYALPQLMGGALLPLLLEGACDMQRRGARGVVKLGAGVALMLLAHLPSAIISLPLVLAYAVLLAPAGRKARAAALALVAAALGFGASALYWWPALVNKPVINTGYFTGTVFSYSFNFLEGRAVSGLLLMTVPVFALYALLPAPARRRAVSAPVAFWLLVIALVLFMNFPISRIVWDHVKPLEFLQFPLRCVLAALPGIVYIGCCWLPQATLKPVHLLIAALFVAALMAGTPNISPREFSEYRERVAAMIDHHLMVAEYHTRWMLDEHMNLSQSIEKPMLAAPPVAVVAGEGIASITRETARSITLHAEVRSPTATLALRRFYFPGWRVAQGMARVLAPQKALLTIEVPRGTQDVTLALPWFDGERAGLIASLASLLVLTAWGLAARRMR